MIVTRNTLKTVNVLSYIIMSTVAWPVVNRVVTTTSDYIRILTILMVLAITILYVTTAPRINKATIFALAIAVFYIGYATSMSVVMGGIGVYENKIYLIYMLVPAGIVIMAAEGTILDRKVAGWLLLYCGFFLCLIIATGSLTLSFPPHFNFLQQSALNPWEVRYNQGVTKFFGLAAIIATGLAMQSATPRQRALYYGLATGAALLTILGGGRGDTLAAFAVIAAMLFAKQPVKFVGLLLFLAFVMVNLWQAGQLESFIFFVRLQAVLEGNIGARETYLLNGIDLLIENPQCLLVGCGFGYFQHYYNQSFGAYPHNFALEAVITWGLPLSLMFLLSTFLIIRGVMTFQRHGDFIPAVFLFFILIYLKSGTVVTGWMLLLAMIVPIGRLLSRSDTGAVWVRT